MNHRTIVALTLLYLCYFHSKAQDPTRLLRLNDLQQIRYVSTPEISPDGEWVAYVVRTSDLKEDNLAGDIWMARWNGTETIQLTHAKDTEHNPRWSPDNKYLAFLSGRDNEKKTEQLWIMNRNGGEAEKLTDVKGGVNDYIWSPDGKQLVLVVEDGDTAETITGTKTPKPIVIDRFYFKEDIAGYLTGSRHHLYIFDIATHKAEIITPGHFNEELPSWSPDGKKIAFVSKRSKKDFDRDDNYDIWIIDAKPGSESRKLTTFEGPDCHPAWGSYPAWSPDGKSIAYIQGGPLKLIYYAVQKLAVIPVGGGEPKILTESVDRNISNPNWSEDGNEIYFLIENDRNKDLAKVAAKGGNISILIQGRHVVADYSQNREKVAVSLSGIKQPFEIFGLDHSGLHQISHQNDALFSQLHLAKVNEISYKSKDGTEVHGFEYLPPDYETGKKYPTLLRIHGGPVDQFDNQWMFEYQMFAAQGYAVLTVNPRGSSGRGEKYASAIWADWGNKDAQDVIAAIDDAIRRGVADPDRLGIGGWSYGAILTAYVIMQDNRYKCATSGAGMSNMLATYGTDMYVREYEQELGVPWKNTDAYLKLSFPFLHADRIKIPILFLCGENDFNVPIMNSEQMYQALKSLELTTQLIIYPGQTHLINKPTYLEDRMKRYLDWYGTYLKK